MSIANWSHPGSLVVTSPSTLAEPVSLSDARQHVAGSTADNSLITAYVGVAREYAEIRTRRAIRQQTYRLAIPRFPSDGSITLPRSPLGPSTNVTVKYIKQDGSTGTFSSTKYVVDADSEPPRITLGYNESWPSDTLQTGNPVRVTFDAGYAGSTDVPDGIKHAIKLIVGDYYMHREDSVSGSIGNKSLARAANDLLDQHAVPEVP